MIWFDWNNETSNQSLSNIQQLMIDINYKSLKSSQLLFRGSWVVLQRTNESLSLFLGRLFPFSLLPCLAFFVLFPGTRASIFSVPWNKKKWLLEKKNMYESKDHVPQFCVPKLTKHVHWSNNFLMNETSFPSKGSRSKCKNVIGNFSCFFPSFLAQPW